MRQAILSLIACVCLAGPAWAGEAPLFDQATRSFAAGVDLSAVERLGVQSGGRVAILDTFARQQLRDLYGQDRIEGSSASFGYLELYFNPSAYLGRPLIQVPESEMRKALSDRLPVAAEFLRDGKRIPPDLLLEPRGLGALMEVDLRGLAGEAAHGPLLANMGSRSIQPILESLAFNSATAPGRQRLDMRYSIFIARGALRLVPPLAGEEEWLAVDELSDRIAPPDQAGHHPPLSPQAQRLHAVLLDLGGAWRARDVPQTNRLLAELVSQLSALNPAIQPSPAKAWAEHTYNGLYRFTLVWVGYGLAFLLMLLAVVQRHKRWPRKAGLAVMLVSTLALAAGVGIRWWLSGRPWYLPPVVNQFESVVGSALLGAVLALGMEKIWPKNFFALGAAFFAMIALLCGFLMPQAMRAEIAPPAGVLNNWILPLHVATIIMGYSLIGIGLVISVLYLVSLARASVRARSQSLSASADLTTPDSLTAGPLAELDRCNLIVAQLACWLVGIGTILGAYWADYSWGRWWGFDAKETWALITWIVYLGIIHIRYVVPARRRGLWTAGLSLAGAFVMLFNWVIVKYLLPSLHGYA